MRQYVIRRLLLILPLVWAVGTVVFLLTRVIPGDAAQVYVGISGDQEIVEQLRELWGLNDSKWTQYTLEDRAYYHHAKDGQEKT